MTSDLTLIQISDTHLRAGGENLRGSVETESMLHSVLDRVRGWGRPVAALLLSGDLSDDGSPDSYRRLRQAVEPAADELGAQILYVMGNHDDRRAFADELLDGQDSSQADSLDQVIDVAGLRIIGMDSTAPGRHDGQLSTEQLLWLDGELAEPADRGTVLVLHHPPVPSPLATTHLLRLQDAEKLAEVVASSDVGLIVCGHNHMTAASQLVGIPVWAGPAMSYQLASMAPAGRQMGLKGAAFSRIDLVDQTLITTVVNAGASEVIYDQREAEICDAIARLHAEG